MKRWFAAADGTFFRNCPLIMSERRECRDPLRARALAREWRDCFREGLLRVDVLPAGDVVVVAEPLHVTYPDHPALWST